MNWAYLTLTLVLSIGTISCKAQTKPKMENNNPLLCKPDSGICEMPGQQSSNTQTKNTTSLQKPIRVIYFTDPICSSCWGIEPQLRKLKLEYGDNIHVEYKMGGLLPDWNYNRGGISKPSDVAQHWDEVSAYYDMPIDGDVWLEDPLHSSYPPSIAFKAAQMQDNEKAILFLRVIREMVFLQKKNITKWEYLKQAAKMAGLDDVQLKNDFDNKAIEHFQEDLKLAKQMGVRGFPTLFFTNKQGKTEIVYGAKPYASFENAIVKLYPDGIKLAYEKSHTAVFAQYHSLTAKEFAELTGTPRQQSEQILDELTRTGVLHKQTTKNGAIWELTNKAR